MYQKGDFVVYGANGVCEVGEVTKLNLDHIPEDREYYVLYPRNHGGKIYLPVDKVNSKIRSIITREEAEKLIKKMPEIEPVVVKNEKLLDETYKKSIQCYDCMEWVCLIKCIYLRRQTRLSEGRKVTATDEKYMYLAEELLYWELATALAIPKEQVLEYIKKEIEIKKE